MDLKSPSSFVDGGVEAHQLEPMDGDVEGSKATFNNDQRDMDRMGKQQQLDRGFGVYAIAGFVSIVMATWEGFLLVSEFGLYNGGSAGIIWMSIVVWLCFTCVVASMAEMASMAPTAGGQYHWVSEFAPPKYQQPLSYIVGWLSCLSWISGIPADAQVCAGLIQGMVLLVRPSASVAANWQTTLIIFFFLVITYAFNLYLARYLPLAEGTILVLHVVGFFAVLITLWAVSDHVPAHQVFFDLQDGGGWGNMGLSVLVGISSPIYAFSGPDSGAHMSEELIDASIVLPRTMLFAIVLNGLMGVAMLITFCFCIPNINAVIDTPTDQPILAVVYNLTRSNAAAIVIGTLLMFLSLASTMSNVAAASRQCWAFSRDQGFPFSNWIMKVDPRRNLPVNAIYVCAAFSFILAAINFGSDVAFNAIVSVSNASLTFSYIISIGCIRLKRWRGQKLLNCRWSLGRWGPPINDISIAFLIIATLLNFFPETPLVGDPTWAADMNWASLMFAAVSCLAFIYYYAGGRHSYVAPVRLVKQE